MNTEGEKRVKCRFSMIVPVYNVKRYLKRCVESLVEQEGAEAKREIILVDDGSTDGSGELCDQFAALYENVVTYHKQNGGLSSARNYGIDRAQGEWVLFVDSDDYVSRKSCHVLETMISDHPDAEVMVYNGTEIEGTHKKRCRRNVQNGRETKGEEYVIYHYKNRSFHVEAWLYAYRLAYLNQNQLRFREGILHEDVEFTLRAVLPAKKIVEIEEPLYYYVIRKNSISTGKNKEKNIHDLFQTLEMQAKFAEKQGAELEKWIKNAVVDSYLNMIQEAGMYEKCYRKFIKKRFLWGKPATLWNHFRVVLCTISPRLYCEINDTYKRLRE